MRLIFFFFFSEDCKFHISTKNAKKRWQKFYGCLGNLISIGNRILSPLLPEYSQFPVNVLSSSPKISELIENNLFNSRWLRMMKKQDKTTLLQISEVFGTNKFTAKGFSEKSPVMHLNKHIFWSERLQKYLTYETHIFFQHV